MKEFNYNELANPRCFELGKQRIKVFLRLSRIKFDRINWGGGGEKVSAIRHSGGVRRSSLALRSEEVCSQHSHPLGWEGAHFSQATGNQQPGAAQ